MKLKLKDLVLLRQELNGLSDRTTGQVFYKGLLLQEIHFKAKYHLSKLSKEVEKEIEQLTESEKELFKKYFGETEPEQTNFSIDDLDFKSSESYPTFIELFLK